ncbi:MAG: hypothetical protein COB02_15360 [Candidatus Cloacimonadota bacterium]|nr:MAG: hypothetical protein COB02_15360 [Candidatus Cloacimonadota bacterium]
MNSETDLDKFSNHCQQYVFSDASHSYIKLNKQDLKITLNYWDTLYHLEVVLHYKIDGIFKSIVLNNKAMLFYKKISFKSDRISWYFEISTKGHIVYYSKEGISKNNPTKSRHFIYLQNKSYPKWLLSSILYQIFVDRFYKEGIDLRHKHSTPEMLIYKSFSQKPDSFQKSKCMDFFGGNLSGVSSKIKYLYDLGITTIYLNPIFEAISHHGYDCCDYNNIAKVFGSNESLKSLSQKLDKYQMNYILDISINHTGDQHKWMKQNQIDFYVTDSQNNIKKWEGVKNLLTLDYTCDNLKEKIYKSKNSILKKWLSPPYNCKGYRFDVGHSLTRDQNYFEHFNLWSDIRKHLKSKNDDSLILVEYWDEASNYLQGNMWDCVTNYFGFLIPLRKFLGLNLDQKNMKKYFHDSEVLVSSLKNALLEIPFAQSLLQINMLGSHDISRLYNHKNLKQNYQALSCLLICYIGVPCLFYGDEICLDGKIDNNEGYRYPMDWESPRFLSTEFTNLKLLISFRKKQKVLQIGSILFLSSPKGTIIFVRKLHEKFCLILLNFTKSNIDFQLTIPFLSNENELTLYSILEKSKKIKVKQLNYFTIKAYQSDVYSNII